MNSFIWSPDGKQLASYVSFYSTPGLPRAKIKEIAIIDAASGTQVALYKSQYASIEAFSWSPDGRYIATAESSSTITRILVWVA